MGSPIPTPVPILSPAWGRLVSALSPNHGTPFDTNNANGIVLACIVSADATTVFADSAIDSLTFGVCSLI